MIKSTKYGPARLEQVLLRARLLNNEILRTVEVKILERMEFENDSFNRFCNSKGGEGRHGV